MASGGVAGRPERPQQRVQQPLSLLQAEREARLATEQKLEHLARRMIGLEAALHGLADAPTMLPRLQQLEQAFSAQLSLTGTPPSTSPAACDSPASGAGGSTPASASFSQGLPHPRSSSAARGLFPISPDQNRHQQQPPPSPHHSPMASAAAAAAAA